MSFCQFIFSLVLVLGGDVRARLRETKSRRDARLAQPYATAASDSAMAVLRRAGWPRVSVVAPTDKIRRRFCDWLSRLLAARRRAGIASAPALLRAADPGGGVSAGRAGAANQRAARALAIQVPGRDPGHRTYDLVGAGPCAGAKLLLSHDAARGRPLTLWLSTVPRSHRARGLHPHAFHHQ